MRDGTYGGGSQFLILQLHLRIPSFQPRINTSVCTYKNIIIADNAAGERNQLMLCRNRALHSIPAANLLYSTIYFQYHINSQ